MSAKDPLPSNRAAVWLATLRIAVGLWFLKSLFTKIDWFPFPSASARWRAFLPERLAEYAAGNPLDWYATFLRDIAIPNADVVAILTAFGESAVGLALTFGLFTVAGAAGGALMMVNYFLASFWMGPNQQGFHLLLLACMLAFAGGRAGHTLGLDALRARRRTDPRFAHAAPAPTPLRKPGVSTR